MKLLEAVEEQIYKCTLYLMSKKRKINKGLRGRKDRKRSKGRDRFRYDGSGILSNAYSSKKREEPVHQHIEYKSETVPEPVDPNVPVIETFWGKKFYIKNFVELGGNVDPNAYNEEKPVTKTLGLDKLEVMLEETYTEVMKARIFNRSLTDFEKVLKERLSGIKLELGIEEKSK